MNIQIINGPNLNMLGKRDPKIYGSKTLREVNYGVKLAFPEDNFKFSQSSYEGKIIDFILTSDADAIVLNAGAYTHYSYAIRDAIDCCGIPVVEVHMSNIEKREDFRKISVIRDVAVATFMGLGEMSYHKAVQYLKENYNG